MKILFMGTPDFAVKGLEKLIESGYEIVGAVSQPDRPKGRGHKMVPTPVKECALNNNIEVFQPETLKDEALLPLLKEKNPDIIIVIAYGRILPEYILNYPKYGCVNIHASLLPKYRGSAPIQWSIINGDKLSGVTSMYMVKELDAGDILIKREIPIEDDDTAGTLFDKLADLGAEVLLETLELLPQGKIEPVKQGDDFTLAPMLTKANTAVDFNKACQEVCNFVRGLNPFPCAYAYLNDESMKILSCKPSDYTAKAQTGEIVTEKNAVYVKCADGFIELLLIVPNGKRAMTAAEYFRGHPVQKGVCFKKGN
ncbi:MAG: methionyl-tRNA formyltransferase [Ruminococcaceae bacterium]|nr:methionyl-tRNA formyltransferase [Oscillospiraceae bacterium]